MASGEQPVALPSQLMLSLTLAVLLHRCGPRDRGYMTARHYERLRMKLGVNLPAVARPKRVLAWPHDEYGAPRDPVVKQPTPVFLYFGIIDILQVREYASWPLVQTSCTHLTCAGG